MNIGKACAICENLENSEATEAEKIEAIKTMADMETHNSITKNTMLRALRYVLTQHAKAEALEIIQVIRANPDLPIVAMVDSDIVADDCNTWWLGHWGPCKITEYYNGRNYLHFKDDDDEEDVLADLDGCKYYCDQQGRDITALSDEEWDKLYAAVPWTKCIAVHIVA